MDRVAPRPESGAAAGLAVEARMPPGWGPLWWMHLAFPLYMTTAAQAENKRHDTAWIVLRNRRGERRDLFWVPVNEADEKRRRVEAELREMSLAVWCERYHVPLDFVDPPPAGVL